MEPKSANIDRNHFFQICQTVWQHF